jgi:hypothetical protein
MPFSHAAPRRKMRGFAGHSGSRDAKLHYYRLLEFFAREGASGPSLFYARNKTTRLKCADGNPSHYNEITTRATSLEQISHVQAASELRKS